MTRTIQLEHSSALSASELIEYFTDPGKLQEWICDFATRAPATGQLTLYYGQDHCMDWLVEQASVVGIHFRQFWMNESETDCHVTFEANQKGTLITVVITGDMSADMEQEYRRDWQGLETLV